MERKKALILCGVFAVSNMGQAHPTAAAVARAIRRTPMDPRSSAIMFGEQYMETNKHENIFAAEAEAWLRRLVKMSEAELSEQHPDLAALYDRANKMHQETL